MKLCRYFLLVCLFIASSCHASAGNLEIKNAERTIDVTSQLVKITHRLTLQNNGKSTIKSFDFPIESNAEEHLAFFKAQLESKKNVEPLQASSRKENGVLTYKVVLNSGLEPEQTVKVLVATVYSHFLNPHPAVITQKEKQLVQYKGNAYIYSPYKVGSQTTKVLLSSSNIESFTRVKPVGQSDTTITYGPYNNVSPWAEESIVVHFENNTPFLSVAQLVREIEVSHWGNIAVKETIDAYHHGAKLKGSFSRFEYQREHSGVSSIKSFKTILPELASDVYYRDEIGNISTSNLREEDGEVILELRPRFPLFGGWKTHYVIGYNLPSFANLFSSGDEYVLKMDFVSHVFDNVIIDDALVRIVLPEGSTNIEVETPYGVTRLPDSLHFTYLDTKGRPVVQFSAKNLVENHIQEFMLKYNFSRMAMLQEPLLCVSAFFLLFLTYIIYARLDFSITKVDETARRKLEDLTEIMRNRFIRRLDLLVDFDDKIDIFNSSKDFETFQATARLILAELGNIDTEVPHKFLHDSRLIERVEELCKSDWSYRKLQSKQGFLIERFISGKLGKPQFAEANKILLQKKSKLLEKINQKINEL